MKFSKTIFALLSVQLFFSPAFAAGFDEHSEPVSSLQSDSAATNREIEADLLQAAPSYCAQLPNFSKTQVKRAPASGSKADFVVVDKSRRLLHLLADNKVIRTYRMGLGKSPKGHKRQNGDNKTPEGLYTLDYKNPNSSFRKALHVSYPNKKDVEWARKNGVSPGGDIMVHGLPNEKWKRMFINHPSDWTRGCVAVNNSEIDEIYKFVNAGTPIELCP